MSESLDHLKRYHWVREFVAMVTSVTPLHKNLYCQLWRIICKEGSSTKKEDIYGSAVFLCYLCTNTSTMLPIILTGIKRPAENHLPEVFSICSYVDALCEHIPISTSQWMEFFLRFSCSYVEHTLEVFNTNVTELKGNVTGYTAYLSPVMLTRMFYLFHRLNIRGESGFYRATLPKDVDCIVRNLVSLPQFQQLQEKGQQPSFSEWCRWELSISAREDFLPDTDRRIYHQYRVLDHYLALRSLGGGCDGCASKACSVIFHTLLDSGSRCAQQQKDVDVSQNDMINLLQDLVPMLFQASTEEANSHPSGETWSGSWLIEQLHVRLKQIQSNAGEDKSKRWHNHDFLLATEVASFMKLAMRLPPYLLFADQLDSTPDPQSITPVVHFINDYLRPYMSDNCCLPFDVTLYILKALLTHTRRPPHESRTPSNSKLLSEFLKDCPLFCASVQNYWKQLKPLAANPGDVTLKALNQAELLLNWKNRVDKSQAVSLRELENMDVSLVASFIAVNLHTMSSQLMTIFIRESKSPTEFTRKLAVCLFDCLMAEFSQMCLHGREIEENAVLRDSAWKLLMCFPKSLSVFIIDERSEFKEVLLRLRSLILKEQLITLYPAVFFSFFLNFPSQALQEAVKNSGFLHVTLRMYNSFVSLRKELLNGVVNMAAVCSPLRLDFCHQITKFVRDCVLSSPVEHIRSLSKDVVASCSSELRQFLQSQLAKRQQR